ncbi:MAG: tyrosine-type recombinase/integrase, partial [Candidatus Omnitrophica bacterium]|nr:tyrosine-type recombinase/integrase [Candidatus Omnitrophota bacterium]
LFILGVYSGFRISELLSIRIGDLIKNGQVLDRVTVARRNMKKKVSSRTVLLKPVAKEAVVEWIEELKSNGNSAPNTFLFRSRKGENRPISRVQAYRVIREACDANDLTGTIGTHSMRKSFANKVYTHFKKELAAGKPVDPFRMTSKALGHKNINSTDQYLSFLEEEIDEAIMAI